nr:zinc finger protein 511 [Quercus suber]
MTKRPREDSLSVYASNSDNASSQAPLHTNSIDVHTAKFTQLSSPDRTSAPLVPINCHLPPHPPLEFPTALHYERHYIAAHANCCTACHANFPSSHLLALHITEHHDPIALAKRDRGEKIYACFVEGCKKLCVDWRKRRSHLVDKHGFPRNYDFFVVITGVNGRRSFLRTGVDEKGHRKSSRRRTTGEKDASNEERSPVRKGFENTYSNTPGSVDGDNKPILDKAVRAHAGDEQGLDELTESLCLLKMVPRSVTFGKPRKGAGLAKN